MPFPSYHAPALRPGLSRRAVLAGSAGLLFLAACGDEGDDQPGATTLDEESVSLRPLFDPTPAYARAGHEQRLAWGLFDFEGAPFGGGPDELTFTVYFEGEPTSEDGQLHEVVAADLAARRRDLDIPRPYYALRFTPEQAGLYTVETEVEGQTLSGPFQVAEEDEPGVVQIGQPLTPVETPTVQNPLGVDPLCTREPPCALHDESLDAVMAEGRPTAFLISTPAFCQTGICGPVLDLLIEARADYPDLSFVHTEVYQQPEPGNPTAGGVVGAVEDYGLTFEPSLFLIDGDALLVDRLDNIYDATELRESLDRINP